MKTVSRYAAIIVYILPLLLISSCGFAGSVRDDYWGKSETGQSKVRRDEYGNPILDDEDEGSRQE